MMLAVRCPGIGRVWSFDADPESAIARIKARAQRGIRGRLLYLTPAGSDGRCLDVPAGPNPVKHSVHLVPQADERGCTSRPLLEMFLLGSGRAPRIRRGSRAEPTAVQGWPSDAVRYVKNTPSCILPICAKADFEVAAGSETKRKPCSAKGVNGGELACVVAVTAIVAVSSIKSPENPTEWFSTCTFRFTPCQRITK